MATKKKRRRRKKGRYHTGVHVSPKTGQSCKYRSGWELLYMQWLDAHAAVLTYSYESLKIPYISNLKTKKVRNYLPDFLVTFTDGSQMLVEVKPKRKLEQAVVKKKLEAARAWVSAHGATLNVITEVELSVMGLL